MVKLAFFASLLALTACGAPASPGSGMQVSLLVDSAVGPLDTYQLRVFGSAVKCGEVLAAPANYELSAQQTCAPAEMDTSSNCLIAYNSFQASSGDDPINDVPPGQRTVFVEGLSNGSVQAHGCAAVTVASGQATPVQVTVK